MAEPVPLRAALERHGHHVVGGADAALVEHAGIGIGAGADHGVNRIGAAHGRIIALGALRTGMVEIERERDHLALAHQARRRDDVLGLGVVERADLVVRAPLAPVLVFLRGVAQVLARDFLAVMTLPLSVELSRLGDRRAAAVYCMARKTMIASTRSRRMP